MKHFVQSSGATSIINLTGSGFSLGSGGPLNTSVLHLFPDVTPGSLIDLSTSIGFRQHPLTFNGAQYLSAGTLTINAVDLRFPSTSDQFVTLQTLFSLSGSLTGSSASTQVALSLQGQGSAQATYHNLNGIYTLATYSYNFTSSGGSPVIPEPSIIWLFGTGLAGLMAWRWLSLFPENA